MEATPLNFVRRSILIIGLICLVVVATKVRGNTPGMTWANFTTGSGIDLKVDSQATYNGTYFHAGTWTLKNLIPGVDKFWNFNDIKPGDQGENTISLHVKNSDAWMCLDFKNLKSADNGNNEPESHEDLDGNADGELADVMEFFAWYDDGDNKFEKGEKYLFGPTAQNASTLFDDKTFTLGDYSNQKIYKANKTNYIAIYWCAGDLTVNLSTAELLCDGSQLGNETQTDSMSVDISLNVVPVKDNPKFNCTKVSEDPGGCSPGYWKRSQHFSKWPAPYTPGTLFSSVFENAFPGKTLLQVLETGGGGLNALGRQTVAALLNAASSEIDFAFTDVQVKSLFNQYFPGGNYEELKNKFEKQNTLSCPLSNSKDKKYKK